MQIIAYSTVHNTTTITFENNTPNVQLYYSKCSVTKFFHEQCFREQRCLSYTYLANFSLPLLYTPFFFFSYRIILDKDTLFISSVTLKDQGVYTCVARTSLDSVTAESQLVVLGKWTFS